MEDEVSLLYLQMSKGRHSVATPRSKEVGVGMARLNLCQFRHGLEADLNREIALQDYLGSRRGRRASSFSRVVLGRYRHQSDLR